MREKTKKVTFNLPIAVITEIDEIMNSGLVRSKNSLVEQALVKELKELKRQERKSLWQEASKDPLFMKDIDDVAVDFQYADAETAREIE